jgi:hypothetical protein
MITKLLEATAIINNKTINVPIERPYNYVIDPKGNVGAFFDIGMAHFPLGTPRFVSQYVPRAISMLFTITLSCSTSSSLKKSNNNLRNIDTS